MPTRTVRKQISIFLPLHDWKAMRAEAARQQIPITELCRRWMHPQMERMREIAGASTVGPGAGNRANPHADK